MLQTQQRADTGAQRVAGSDRQRALIDISAADRIVDLQSLPCFGLGLQTLPKRSVVLLPSQKTIVLACKARRSPCRDHRRLDRQRARTTHRVEKLGTALAGL